MNFTNLRRELRAYVEKSIKDRTSESEFKKKVKSIASQYFSDSEYKDTIIDAIVNEYSYTNRNALLKEERTTLSELFTTVNQDFAKTKNGITKDVVKVINQGLKAQEFSREIQTRVESVIGKYRNYANTITRTSIAGFDTIIKHKDDKPTDKYTYIHVPTKRPFCVAILNAAQNGKTWTREEIENMNNGQGLNVFYYCGGYNCRGHFQRVEK